MSMAKRLRLIRDARGHPSWTATLVVPAFTALTAKFLAGGFTFPVVGVMPVISGIDYAAAAVALLTAWVYRDAKDKDYDLKVETRAKPGGSP